MSGGRNGVPILSDPRISVIIPHLNQPEFLARCLTSLKAGRREADEIFVVDNGSHVLPVAVLAAHPDATLLQEPTPGPSPARNLSLAAASGDILAFIDADCLADAGWLEPLRRRYKDRNLNHRLQMGTGQSLGPLV